jgi:hypothetical protein
MKKYGENRKQTVTPMVGKDMDNRDEIGPFGYLEGGRHFMKEENHETEAGKLLLSK